MQTQDFSIKQVKDFSIKEALLFGFRKTNEHILLILSIELLFFCIWLLQALAGAITHGIPDKIADPNFLQKSILIVGSIIHNMIPLSIKSQVLFALSLFILASLLATLVLLQGVRRIMLDIYDKNESSLSQIYSQVDIFSVILLAKFLYLISVLAGSICIILPGIYLSAKYGFYAYVLLDDQTLGPVDAFKKSGQITKGFVNHLCVYNILWIILLILSILTWIGWIIIVPVLVLSDTYIYRQITSQSTETN
ncbi:MAG: hypothetical protein AB7F19_03460 [Candidatus Babeliales bacterium]